MVAGTPQRAGTASSTKIVGHSTFASGGTALKRSSVKSTSASNLHNFSKTDLVPAAVIMPRTSSGAELDTGSRSYAADVPHVLSKASRRAEPANDPRTECADVAPAVVPRTSTRMEMASDSAPDVASRTGRRFESPADSRKQSADAFRKESADAAPVVTRATLRMEMASDSVAVLSKAGRRFESSTDSRKESTDAAPAVVPRATSRMKMASDSTREPSAGRVPPFRIQSRYAETRKSTNAKVDKDTENNDLNCQIFLPRRNGVQTINTEETREDVKHNTVYRSGFSVPAESNTSHRSDSCMILALNILISIYCCIVI